MTRRSIIGIEVAYRKATLGLVTCATLATIGCSSSSDSESSGALNTGGGAGAAAVGSGGAGNGGSTTFGSGGSAAGMGSGLGGNVVGAGGALSSGGAMLGNGGAPAVGGASGVGGSSPAGGTGATGGAEPAAGGSGDGGMPNPAGDCTRESLAATIDAYFAGLTAHDPSGVALAPTVRSTENAGEIQVGQEGLWQTAGETKFRRSALDTERCGTVTEAVIANDGTDTIIGVRLKLENQEITEIETFIVDPENGFFPTPEGLIGSAGDDWGEVLPPEQRSTREDLNAAADAYFDLFSDPSADVPFGTPCVRLENGFQTTFGDCSTGIPPGSLRMTNRRYPVADLEAGIAIGFTQFGGSLLDFHMHKVIDGKIRGINAVVGPAATSSGWD